MSFETGSLPGHTRRIVDDDIDYTVFARRPLSDREQRTLRYLRDVNRYLPAWLHDTASAARSDRSTTAPLAQCALEKASHGEVLDKTNWSSTTLRRPLSKWASTIVSDLPRRGSRRAGTRWADSLVGADSLAVPIVLVAVNEWFVIASYRRLLGLQRHLELEQVIVRNPGPVGARLAIQMGGPFVTAAVMPARETAFLMRYLMGGPEGAG